MPELKLTPEQAAEAKSAGINIVKLPSGRTAAIWKSGRGSKEGELERLKAAMAVSQKQAAEERKPKLIEIEAKKPAVSPATALPKSEPTKFVLKPTPFETRDTRRKGPGFLPTLLNTIKAVTEFGVECRYDVFHDKMIVNDYALSLESIDDVCLVLRTAISGKFGFEPSQDLIMAAVRRKCLENRFDPVVDYLDGLKWDGVRRLDTILLIYFKAKDEPLNRAIGRKMMIAAVRRARKPGCKFDYIVVMDTSEQGKKKSTAIEVLAGSDNFSDAGILDCDEKTQMELIQGVWIYELGELSGMSRADVNKVKLFASRKVDRARPAYGRTRVDRQRRCIFIGSTNDDEYLKDTTGNRRFWPFIPGDIDVEALKRDRDQLWAEAAAAEAVGEELVIPEELWPQITERQQSRMSSHPWEDRVAGLADLIAKVGGTSAGAFGRQLNDDGEDELRVSSDWILTDQLHIPPERLNEGQGKTLKGVMRKLGWDGPEKIRIGGVPVRGYWKKVKR
jgi:hypothetical protein